MQKGGLRTHGITKSSTTEKPLITVVTVVYNGEATLEQTILSVVNQTYDNVEYIIIDGASTDGTLDIIKKYEDRIDYWQSGSDKGIYDAMNKGIGLATGEYVALLNAGDWYERNTCEIVIHEVKASHADVYYGLLRNVNSEHEVMSVKGNTINNIARDMISHPTCFISNEIYKKYTYSLEYKSASDYDFVARLVQDSVHFQFIEQILCNFLLGGMSSGMIGDIETNAIRYKYNYISFRLYILGKIKNTIKRIVH